MTTTFTVYGKAAPYSVPAQVRHSAEGKAFAHHYPSANHESWKNSVAGQSLEHKPDALWHGAVALSLEFVRVPPKSNAKHPDRCRDPKRRAKAVDPISNPDLLKLARVVEDALTKIFWHDDSQVIQHTFSKRWGEAECVNVRVEFLEWDREAA